MSLKENVDYIKKEISTEESFLESVLKVENFYKKYKVAIFATVAVVILGFGGMAISEYMNEKKTIEVNNAFNKVLANPEDQGALADLKAKSPKLYELAVYSQDRTKDIQIDFFKELSAYTKSVEMENTAGITKVSQDQKFLIKDFAIFNKALIEAKEGKYNEAKASLKLIPITSEVTGLAKMLEHYLLTK